MTQSLPLPITAAMLTKANPHEGKPRYSAAGVADWSMGAVGNDIDIATVSTPVVDRANGGAVTPYPIRTQVAKGAAMVPPLTPLSDLGKDYGEFSGETGRDGYTEPGMPYGPPPEPEEP